MENARRHTAAMTRPHLPDPFPELPPKVTVLSGGVGGARFLQGVLRHRGALRIGTPRSP